MVWSKELARTIDQHCKVIWAYRGYYEIVTEMYDKPRRLCYWWIKEHRSAIQYARGRFYVSDLIYETKTS
jgi:hypothetical protein